MESKYETYLKATVKQAGLTFSARIIGYLLGFFNQVIYARLLGADLYGVFSIGATIMGVTTMFTVFGLNGAMVRFIGTYYTEKEKVENIIRFGLLIVSLLGTVGALILIVSGDTIAINIFHDPRIKKLLPYFAIGVTLSSIRALLDGVFRGLRKPSVFLVYSEIFGRILRVGTFVLLYILGIKLIGLVIALLISMVFSLLGMFIHLFKEKIKVFSSLRWRTLNKKEILAYSSNMIFISFTYFLMGQVNRLILGMYLDSTSVGIYTVSDTISTLSTFVLISFNSIFASIIADLYHHNQHEALKNMYSNITRWAVSLTIPITLWMIIFSEEILTIFGKEYTLGKWVLFFLVLGRFADTFAGSNGFMLLMSKYQKLEMVNSIMVASLNILLNIFLIPKLGIVGSAVAGGIAITTVNIIRSFEVYFGLRMIPYNRKYLKALAATAVVAFSLFLLKLFLPSSIIGTIAALAISLTVMSSVLLVLGLYPEDKMILRTIMAKMRGS